MTDQADDRDPTVSDRPRRRGSLAPVDLPARFSVKGALGEGGMGTVIQAYDRVLLRDVAIKILAQDQHGDPVVGTRFLREARAAARLRHPGIVQVHDIDVENGFIVMELVTGESLAARLWRETKLSPDEVMRIGSAMARALAAAHAAGIVHRDVKPANVLLGANGEVKLADFGVAYFGDSDVTMPGTRVGTPAYMAPEQLRGKDVDARADVYSAGVTLYEAVMGERPSDDREFDAYQALVASTGHRVLSATIARAIRDRPSERFADGGALAEALDATEAPAVPPRASLPRAARRRWPVAVALVGVLALVGAGAWYLRVGTRSAPGVSHRTIALLPFVDNTKDPMLDFAAAGLPNLLGFELHGASDVTVLGYYKLQGVAGANAARETWIAAARQLGAQIIVHGAITAEAKGRVHVAIFVDTIGGVRIASVERNARVQDVPDVVRRAAPELVTAALGRKVTVDTRASTSFSAERELQLGIAELEREHITEAATHLRAAIRHDPGLALGHYYLAVVLSWDTPPPEPTLEAIDKANATGKLDDAQREMLVGVGHIARMDYPAGIATLRPLAEKHPSDRDILYALFESLFHGGYPAEAMIVYRRIHALAPKFRLALVHSFTYYLSHFDEPGMAWALELNDPTGDTYSPLWEPRILMARREYGAAIDLLSRLIATTTADKRRPLQNELVMAYAVSGQLDLAAALVDSLDETSPTKDLGAHLALATVRGDSAERAKWFDAQLRQLATQPPGAGRTLTLAMLAGAQLPVASASELDAIEKGIRGALVPTYERSLNLQIAQVMLAEARGDSAQLTASAASPYPEVNELARAAIARRAGDSAAAAQAVRKSIAATGDARFLITQWWRLAGDLRAIADHSGVIAACDEALRPRLMLTWAWAATASDCLTWTAEASTALGKPADARAAWTQLIALRTAAGDPIVARANAALAALPR